MAVKSVPVSEEVAHYWRALVEKHPKLRLAPRDNVSFSKEQLDTFQKIIQEKVQNYFSAQRESDSPRTLSMNCGKFVYDSILEGAAETAKFGKRLMTLALPDLTMSVTARAYSVMQHYKASPMK